MYCQAVNRLKENIDNFYTWLIIMFLSEWNVTNTYSCVHLNVTGE